MGAACFAAPWPAAPAAAPEFFGLVPAGPIADRNLSDRAKVELAALAVLARGSRTWVHATLEEIALAAGHSVRKVREGLRELTAAGLVEWESIGAKFRVLFRLRGRDEIGPSPEAPRLAENAEAEPDMLPVSLPVCVRNEPPPRTPYKEDRELRDNDDRARPPETGGTSLLSLMGSPESGDAGGGEEAPVHEPDYHPQLPGDDDGESERLDALVDRCEDIFGYTDRERIAGLVRRFGIARVEAAAAVAERRSPRPSSLGYLAGILENWRSQGIEVKAPGQRRKRKEPPMQNYNPGPKYDPVPAEERTLARDWRALARAVEEDPPGVLAMPGVGVPRRE